MSALSTLKDAIKTRLDALVTATTLKGATITDLRKNPLDEDIQAFPWAFLMPPATDSDVVDNRTVLRTFTFDIMVVEKAENITSSTQIENLLEAVLNEFDNNPTLGGTADGAVLPATSAPQPIDHLGKNFTVFFVQLKCNRTQSLTY